VDATLIAHYCQMHQPPAWTPPSPEISELQALIRRLETLVQMRTMETNRLAAGVSSGAVRASLEATVAFLSEQIQQTEKAIRDLIKQHSGLKQKRDLLLSIPGVGPSTAALLLSELPHVSQFQRAGQAAAFAGWVPRVRQSGTSVHSRPRLSKFGSPRLRKGCSSRPWSLCASTRWCGIRGAAALAGQEPMAVVGAAMRKLLHIAFGVLKSGKPFDPNMAAKAT
jgi:transposase